MYDRVVVFTEKLPGSSEERCGGLRGSGSLRDMLRLIWNHKDFASQADADEPARVETLRAVKACLELSNGALALLRDRHLLARAVVHFEKALGFWQVSHEGEGVPQVRFS